MHRGADWIVRIEHRLDGAFFQVAGHDPPGDALAGGVRETLVHELWLCPGLVDRLVKLPVPSARSLLVCGSRGSSGDVADCRTPR